MRHHLESFDYFVEHKLGEIITSSNNKEVKIEADPDFWLEFRLIKVMKPDFDGRNIFPHDCRVGNITYSSKIT